MGFLKTKKGKICIIAAAAVIIAAAALIIILNSAIGYRSISVAELFGRVTAQNGGSSYAAYQDMKLFDGYSLETDAASYSRLVLDGEKYIKLEESSLARFEKLGRPGSDLTEIRLERGAMTNELTKPLGDDGKYVVNTPNAVLAVRGTYFRVEVSFSESGEAYSDVYVYGGAVACRRVMPDGTVVDEDIVINAGYKARIKMDEIITIYVEEMIEQGRDNADPIEKAEISDPDIVGMYCASDSGHEMFLTTRELWEVIKERGIDVDGYTSQYDNGRIPHFDGYEEEPVHAETTAPASSDAASAPTAEETSGTTDDTHTSHASNSAPDGSQPGGTAPVPGTQTAAATSPAPQPEESEPDNSETAEPSETSEPAKPTDPEKTTAPSDPSIPEHTSRTSRTEHTSHTSRTREETSGSGSSGSVTEATSSTSVTSATSGSSPATSVTSVTSATSSTSYTTSTSRRRPGGYDTPTPVTTTTPATSATTTTPATSATTTTPATSATTTTSATSATTPPPATSATTSTTATTAHTHVWEEESQASTCTEQGWKKVWCPECGTVQSNETLPLAPHTEVTETVPATCTEAGSETISCSVCKAVLSTSEIPAKGHTEQSVTTPATCTEAGNVTVKCSVCGEVISVTEIPAKGHTPVTEITPSTVDKKGRKLVYCSVCQFIISDEELPEFAVYTDNGDIVITSTGYSVGGGEVTAYTGKYVISQTDSGIMYANITVESGAHDITLAGVNLGGMLTVGKNAEVKLDGTGTNYFSPNQNSTNTSILVEGTLTISSGTYILDGASDQSSLIAVGADGGSPRLDITGGSIEGRRCDRGISVNNGTAEISGGKLDFSAMSNMNCLDISAGQTLTISGGSVDLGSSDLTLSGNLVITGGCVKAAGADPSPTNGVDKLSCRVYSEYPADKLNITRGDGTAYSYALTSADAIDGKYYIWLPSAENTFPDETLRDYVLNNFDADGDGGLDPQEIAAVTEIDVSGTADKDGGVNSLQGIEIFTGLTSLKCRYNSGITEVDTSAFPGLEVLNVGNTSITQLDISANPALRELYCSSTGITSLALGGSPALEKLHCSDTSLDKLDISGNTALTELSCADIGLTALDVTGLTELTALWCGGNAMNSLDISANTKLTILHCNHMGITALDLGSAPDLVELNCADTMLKSLDVSGNAALEYLKVENTALAYIDLTGTAVNTLYASRCQYEIPSNAVRVNAADIPGMNKANISNVTGADYDVSTGVFSNITSDNITYTYDCGNGFTETFSLLRSGAAVDYGTEISADNFPDSVLMEYVASKFDTDLDGFLSDDEINAVTMINVSGDSSKDGGVTSLEGIKLFPNLINLYCDYNSAIDKIDVSSNPALQSLSCDSTEITSLDVSSNKALKQLRCSSTGITSLDVSSNLALEILYCHDTGITNLDVSSNKALRQLHCGSTGITSLDVSSNTELTSLWFDDTAITELKYSSLDKLQNLDCRGTNLTSLPLDDMPVLAHLSCRDMPQLTSLDVTVLPELVELTCNNTSITSLDLSQNPKLANLWIYNTNLAYIDITQNTKLTKNHFLSSGCKYPIPSTATEFDMTTIPGIDITKITYTGTTADFDQSTGVFSNITGNITYTYDCGNGLTADFTLTRTL